MPRRAARPREVFVSHSSRDRAFAARIIATLNAHGVPTWYSESSIRGAQQWHDEIGEALRRCDWFAVILSPHSVKSEWVKRELLFALGDSRLRGRIVPIMNRKCAADRLSWTLGHFETIDFRGRYGDGCRELLRIWGIGFRP